MRGAGCMSLLLHVFVHNTVWQSAYVCVTVFETSQHIIVCLTVYVFVIPCVTL